MPFCLFQHLLCFVLFFSISGSLVQTGHYTEQMQKSLDSFIRKRPPPESYEEETVDHEKPQQTGTVLNTTEDSQKCYEEK